MSDRLKVRSGFCWDLDEADIFHNNTIDEAIEQILKIKSRLLESGYNQEHEYKFEVYHGFESTDLTFVGFRYETDDEYNARLEKIRKTEERKKQKKQKKQIPYSDQDWRYPSEEHERIEYERLKAKFEK